MKRYRVILSAALLVLGLAGTTTPGAAADETVDWLDQNHFTGSVVADTNYMTVREGDGWTSFEYKNDLTNTERRIHTGKREGESCLFSGSRTISGDSDTVSVEREVATNTSECLMVTEVGETTTEHDHSQEPSSGVEETEVAAPLALIESAGMAPQATRSGWHRTRYLDPPGITVTRTTNNVTWNYSGGFVTSTRSSVL